MGFHGLRDKIIQFPTDRIVKKRKNELDAQRKKMGEKVAKQIQQQQTKQFVETAVDDISMNLLKSFVDLAMKTNNPTFTKDLALLVDVMRGLILSTRERGGGRDTRCMSLWFRHTHTHKRNPSRITARTVA